MIDKLDTRNLMCLHCRFWQWKACSSERYKQKWIHICRRKKIRSMMLNSQPLLLHLKTSLRLPLKQQLLNNGYMFGPAGMRFNSNDSRTESAGATTPTPKASDTPTIGKTAMKSLLQSKHRNFKHSIQQMRSKARQRLKSENIHTIPNYLTLSRILVTPALGYSICNAEIYRECPQLSLYLFCYAGVTDWLDGWIARRYPRQRSIAGSLLDPLADKILMTTLTLSLAYSGASLSPYLAALIIGRDVGIMAVAGWYRWTSLPREQRNVGGFADFSKASVQMRPTMVSKVNTALQLMLMGFALSLPLCGGVYEPVFLSNYYHLDLRTAFDGVQWIVGASTLLSGLDYVRLVLKQRRSILRIVNPKK